MKTNGALPNHVDPRSNMYEFTPPAWRTGFADPHAVPLPSQLRAALDAAELRRLSEPPPEPEGPYAVRFALDGYGSAEASGPEPRGVAGLFVATAGALGAGYSFVKLAAARTPDERDNALLAALFSSAVAAFGVAVT